MEIISKVSKGSKMDQIYIPKNRPSLPVGTYVKITPITKTKQPKFYYYNVKDIAPIKVAIMTEIIAIINKYIEPNNIIFTGSFVDKGFYFNDIDIVVITEIKKLEKLEKEIEKQVRIKIHLIPMTYSFFIKVQVCDPIMDMMLSKCMATKRLTPVRKRKLDYQLLDIRLLSGETLPLSFEFYSGKEKYHYTMSMIAISQFIDGKKLSKEGVNKEIEKQFMIKVNDIKQNTIEDRKAFKKRFKTIYKETFDKIMDLIPKNDKK